MNVESFKEILRRQKASGLSVRDFCFNEGLTKSTFYYWLRKIAYFDEQPKEFIPLLVADTFPAVRKEPVSKKMTQPVQVPVQNGASLEFVFPNGTRLLVGNKVDLDLLQTIAHLYD